MSCSMPYLAIAASVSPPPAMLNAFDAAIARAMVSVPAAKAANSNPPTGPFQPPVRASLARAASPPVAGRLLHPGRRPRHGRRGHGDPGRDAESGRDDRLE